MTGKQNWYRLMVFKHGSYSHFARTQSHRVTSHSALPPATLCYQQTQLSAVPSPLSSTRGLTGKLQSLFVRWRRNHSEVGLLGSRGGRQMQFSRKCVSLSSAICWNTAEHCVWALAGNRLLFLFSQSFLERHPEHQQTDHSYTPNPKCDRQITWL